MKERRIDYFFGCKKCNQEFHYPNGWQGHPQHRFVRWYYRTSFLFLHRIIHLWTK